MDPMTDAKHISGQTLTELLNSFGKPDLPEDLHRITWFIDDGAVKFELECLHENFPERFVCVQETATVEPDYFIESFVGDRTPIRDGVITASWEGRGEESELSWSYVAEPAPLDTVPSPDEKLLLELRALEEYFTASLSEENGRHVSYSASSAYEDAIRRVRQVLTRHTEPADTTDADARSLAALSDEVSYCLFFRPSTALGPTSPAAQKVTRLAGWLHTDGWRRTGPVRPLETLEF